MLVLVAELKRVAYQDGVTAGDPHLGLGVIDLTPLSSHISRLDDGDLYLGSSDTRSTHAFSDRTFLDELLHSHTCFQHYRSCRCDKSAFPLQVFAGRLFLNRFGVLHLCSYKLSCLNTWVDCTPGH